MAANSSNTEEKMKEFREVFESALSSIAANTGGTGGTSNEKRCLILSGGVDTCAILAAAQRRGIKFHAAITVVTSEDSPDLGYSVAAAKQDNGNAIAKNQHHVLRVSAEDLVKKFLPKCVEKLHCFDGMTLRNSLIVAAAFEKVKTLGCTHAIVGDGADELFAGYSFMWGEQDPILWKQKRDEMCKNWTFASVATLAECYEIVSHSPYTHPDVVAWALAETQRDDCIGTRSIQLMYGGKSSDTETGKLILRKSYETVASWRRKDPIEVGSGVTVIGNDAYWSDTVSDATFEKETSALLKSGYVIQSKEQLVNYRAFAAVFGADGERLPGEKKRLPPGEGCAGCRFEVVDPSFCKICGAWPAERTK